MNTPIDDSGEFGFVEPFGVDNGELDGLSLQQAFVLGYEFAKICAKADIGTFPFEQTFHSDNEQRVSEMLERRNLYYEILVHDDWPHLIVYGASSI